jgi:hypothetical protein
VLDSGKNESHIQNGICGGACGWAAGSGRTGSTSSRGTGCRRRSTLCEGCVADQPLRGELMLIVNTKLTDSASNFTINFPIDGEGRYVGNALYLYDPTKVCDWTAGCRLAKVGNLWLDDAMGPISVGDDSLRRFSVRDLAWHPDKGLWGLSYDPLNDEWGLTTLTVPDWRSSENRIETVRYAFKYGPVDDGTTDACYWRQSMTGLGFVGDTLYAGSAGKPGNGLDARGAVFAIDDGVRARAGALRAAERRLGGPAVLRVRGDLRDVDDLRGEDRGGGRCRSTGRAGCWRWPAARTRTRCRPGRTRCTRCRSTRRTSRRRRTGRGRGDRDGVRHRGAGPHPGRAVRDHDRRDGLSIHRAERRGRLVGGGARRSSGRGSRRRTSACASAGPPGSWSSNA